MHCVLVCVFLASTSNVHIPQTMYLSLFRLQFASLYVLDVMPMLHAFPSIPFHSPQMHPQEESNKRQLNERRVVEESIQAERRATEKYKAELDKEVQRERALAEAEGRTLERRKNEDIYRR